MADAYTKEQLAALSAKARAKTVAADPRFAALLSKLTFREPRGRVGEKDAHRADFSERKGVTADYVAGFRWGENPITGDTELSVVTLHGQRHVFDQSAIDAAGEKGGGGKK